jgi:hypothetical protein
MRRCRILGAFLMALVISSGTAFAMTQQEQQANAELELMAKDIAQLCATPGFRGFLRSEIAKSKNREGIIELDKFLDRAAKQKNIPPGLNQVAGKMKEAKGRHKAMNLTGLEGFDLYIPVEAHRAKWKGGKDFIVAASAYGNENEIRQIVGFTVWDGKRVVLDPAKAPDTVVVILAPEEHVNHDIPQPEPKDPAMDAPHDDNPKPDAGKDEKHNSYFSMSYLKIHKDGEPWYKGDPEIYLLAGQICNGEGKGYYYDLAKVNKTNTWYYTYYLNQMYFDTNCSWDTYYSVWERDGSGGGVYMYTNQGQHLTPHIRCYPDQSCDYRYVQTLWRGNSDDPIHTYDPAIHTSKMLGQWYYHNYDGNYSDTRNASAKFYKRH